MTACQDGTTAGLVDSLVPGLALVGGRWISDGEAFPVLDPATGATIGHAADGDGALAARAVEAASLAFPVWRATPVRERSRLLRRWHDLVLEHQPALARLISLETGKPMAEASAETAYAASYIDWFAGEALRSDGDLFALSPPGQRGVTLKQPVGVAAIITPWNFPLAMVARKLAPALAAGCAVVSKPSEDTPLCALALARLAERAGLPDGVVNVVPASRARAPEVAEVWLADARVRKLSFTGSTAVGKSLARASADTLKRVSLELGGDAPFLVFDDADLDVAVSSLMKAKFRNAGQACIAVNRVMVHDAVFDAFVDRLVAAAGALRVGPAGEADFDIGPLINPAALAKVESLVEDAMARGASIRLGGSRSAVGASFFEPTVLTGVTPGMRVSREEIFGPVVAVSRFSSEAEAVDAANDTPYGLAAYVCTRDQSRLWRMAEALEFAMIGVNEGAISAEFAPFGGMKESGYGREGSRYGLAEYQTLKYLCIGALEIGAG